MDSCWKAYIVKGINSLANLTIRRKKPIQEKIQDCHNDIKKLCRLLTHLTGTEPQNALPNDANSSEDLADSFADFFQSMTEKICKRFVDTETYNLESKGISKLCQVTPMTESVVKTIIMTMKSKSCEIHPIYYLQYFPLLPKLLTCD